ncbi:MAG: hydroxyacid dehydrogenase [Ruminococcaceae bacterium]|nr:hydroxyacid dehydrogenase [Oscillospiraceae bacterium]
MKITVLDAKTLGDDVDVKILGDNVVAYDTTEAEMVAERIADTDVVVINKIKLNESNLKDAKNLKLICVAATGFDNIDTEYCKKRGIALCNVRGYSTQSVAQLTVSMALSLVMHQKEYNDFVRDGSYTRSGVANRLSPTYYEVDGKVWGVVGLGNIGKQVAKVAQAMGCKVLAFKRTPDENYNCVALAELMEKSDIISVHLPAGAETNGIISKEMIAKMKKTAVFVNVARGAVVDEEALTQAVLEDKILGVGIDVYSKEPFDEDHCFNKIKDLDNVILTPHIAWGAYEARVRCLNEIKLNIESFTRGEERNRVV